MSSWDSRNDPPANVYQLPLRIKPARLPDPSAIPPRPWLYGKHLLKGFVTVLVSPGGTGKSQIAMGIAMSVALQRRLLGHYVFHQANAWVFNLEDPVDEMDRRIAAMMIHHKVGRDELDGRLFLHSGRDRPLCIARTGDDGSSVVFPDKEALVIEARAADIGLIVVDPYIRSHELDENSNTEQAQAASAWAQIADELRAAVLLVHHTRKGAVVDVDAARGAKALTDHARSALILSAMTEEEAKGFNIPVEERYMHIRLDDAKANMAPRSDVADWYRMASVELGNSTADYPNGDHVTAIEPWKPPAIMLDLTDQDVNNALTRIAQGYEPGVLYAPTNQGKGNDRWVGKVLMDMFGVTKESAAKMVVSWLASGLLVKTTFHDQRTRKDATGVTVDDRKRPG